ncbi:MAG: epoxyqueuosine reductase QueH [Synergistaceae bacterium]|nr:epoxyqueuosine reductase QueH [Synergistaceae bacterium]
MVDEDKPRLLLHICCAPDGTVPALDLAAEGWDVTGFFYGSNIQPEEEYRRRLDALHILTERAGFPALEACYAPEGWTAVMTKRGLMDEPEGGRRCTACFTLQLEAAAQEAARQGCSHLCTTLTISPHKDAERINRIGAEIAASHGFLWENRIWRKRNGFLRSIRLSKEWGLYRQRYCGCLPSRRGNT